MPKASERTNLESEHLVLHGTLHDEPFNADFAQLSQPVDSVDRLLFDGRVPAIYRSIVRSTRKRGRECGATKNPEDVVGRLQENEEGASAYTSRLRSEGKTKRPSSTTSNNRKRGRQTDRQTDKADNEAVSARHWMGEGTKASSFRRRLKKNKVVVVRSTPKKHEHVPCF